MFFYGNYSSVSDFALKKSFPTVKPREAALKKLFHRTKTMVSSSYKITERQKTFETHP
jgi:hypothetical protein